MIPPINNLFEGWIVVDELACKEKNIFSKLFLYLEDCDFDKLVLNLIILWLKASYQLLFLAFLNTKLYFIAFDGFSKLAMKKPRTGICFLTWLI